MTTRFAQFPTGLNVHREVGGGLASGAEYENGVPVVVDVAVYGAGGVRFYGKFTAAGSLAIETLRWDGVGVYDTNPVSNVAVSANTEFIQDVYLLGERGFRLTFTPSGDGAVTYLDVTAALGIAAPPP